MTIVVTGAGSGIGRALAIECAHRGSSVAVADIEFKAAAETKEQTDALLKTDSRCTAHELDVTQLEAWRVFQEEVLHQHGAVDGIINNAGVSFSGTVEDTSYQQLERVMSVNFMGMVYGSKEFLPVLKSRPNAFIANISSVFGLFPMKHQSAYCASKFAIRGFTEVLAQELKHTNITVSSIHPGHVGTDILENARKQGNVVSTTLTPEEQEQYAAAFKARGLSPSRAAQVILDDLEKGKNKIVVGRDAVRGDRLSRLFPVRFINAANAAAPS